MPLHIVVVLLLFTLGAGLVAGYALRGAIRRELTLTLSESAHIAGRLEQAALRGFSDLEAEVVSIVAALKAKL